MLYRLSYVGVGYSSRPARPGSSLYMERETGFEPATRSLEGFCSGQLSYSRLLTPAGTLVERSGFEPL